MADKVTLSYQGLADQAQAVLRQKQEYDNLMKKIKTTATNLHNIWEDAAASNFVQKVNDMQKTFDAFGKVLEDVGNHMKAVSDTYSDLSKKITNSQKGF